jgi:HAD superfamily hydrolase (TIGR01549 family)
VLRGCAFDLGNTLINDAAALEDTVREMDRWLLAGGHVTRPDAFATVYTEINRAAVDPFISHTFGELPFFERTLARLGVTSIDADAALRAYRGMLAGRMALETATARALRWLRERGLKTALVSNESSARVEAFVAINDGATLFDEVVVSQAVGSEKPEPAIFLEALRRLRLSAAEVVMIGDNEIADGACRAVGIPFVLATAFKRAGWGWETGAAHPPDLVIERVDVSSLERVLEHFGGHERTTESKATPNRHGNQ